MAGDQPVWAVAGEKTVTCGHCGQGWFWHRRAVMSSSTASMFGVDAFSPEAALLSCTACGRIELFEPASLRLFGRTS